MSVGMPQSLLLQQFGSYLIDMFDEIPYHVGSSLEKKDGWRDVDVRIMLDDDKWDSMKFGDPDQCHKNAKWVAYTMMLSEFGKHLTGLPIDCQIQKTSDANNKQKYPGNRSAIGLVPHRFTRS